VEKARVVPLESAFFPVHKLQSVQHYPIHMCTSHIYDPELPVLGSWNYMPFCCNFEFCIIKNVRIMTMETFEGVS